MPSLSCPIHWHDLAWLRHRAELINFLETNETSALRLDLVEWIDLQPLVDLLLQLNASVRNGRRVVLVLPTAQSASGTLRTVRFLRETGFFGALTTNGAKRDNITHISIGGDTSIPANRFNERFNTLFSSLPPRALHFAVLLPCQVVDARQFESRGQVFDFCRDLKVTSLSGKPRLSELSGDLIYHAKIFFDTVLPELVDNTRLHKPADTTLMSLFVRVRMREERLFRSDDVALPTWAELTQLDKMTQHLWQFDTVEAAVSDEGPSIQDSWLASWKRRSVRTNAVPRLPESGKRVTGPNADAIILHGVFEQNMSSLTADERSLQDLPTVLTGLHSIRQSIDSLDWSFSIRSGLNYVTLTSGNEQRLEPEARYKPGWFQRWPRTPGVQVLFRFAAPQGRPLKGWFSGIREGDHSPGSDPAWWRVTEIDQDSRLFHTFEYLLPPEAGPGSVVLCRPAHVVAKGRLLAFLRDAEARGIKLLFCDVPVPIALRLSLMIESLMQSDALDVVTPTVTNTWLVNVPGFSNTDLPPSLVDSATTGLVPRAWWLAKGSPVRTIPDLFRACREYDSAMFWKMIHVDSASLLTEPVRWSDGIRLIGGYLSFAAALRDNKVMDLVRRSVLRTVHALKATNVVASSEAVKHLAREVERYMSVPDGQDAPRAILGTVRITGSTLSRVASRTGKDVPLPVFDYPRAFLLSEQSLADDAGNIRALDWSPKASAWAADAIASGKAEKPQYSRLGRTGRIRVTPDKLLQFSGLQPPETAYRVWQRHELIRVGHFCGTYYHHFLWLDLVGFLAGKSNDANELVSTFATRIASFAPHAIFYEPNEASEILLHAMKSYARAVNLPGFPEHAWPVGVILDYSHLPTDNVRALSDVVTPPSGGKAVFLDSIRVSGQLSARVRAHLVALGYQETLDVVILDRAQDVESTRVHRRLAWWTLSAPRLGSPQLCTLCRGADSLNSVAAHTRSVVFLQTLESWVSSWTLTRSGDTRYPTLRDHSLSQPVTRRLGKSVTLTTRNALLTWLVELLSRLSHFSYLCERTDRPDAAIRTVTVIAVLLHYWNELDVSYQRRMLDMAVEQLWSETDTATRSLLVLALCSLQRSDLLPLVKLLRDQMVEKGVPHLDVGLAAYALIHLAHPDRGERQTVVESLRRTLAGADSTPDARRARDLLALWTASTRGDVPYRSAIHVIGMAGRGLQHAPLCETLRNIAEAKSDRRDLPDLIAETFALLEPVRAVILEQERRFRRYGSFEAVQACLGAFDEAGRRHLQQSTPTTSRDLRDAAATVERFISADIAGQPNIRQIVAPRYVHYLPYVVRSAFKKLLRPGRGGMEGSDIFVRPMITSPERTLTSKGELLEAKRSAVEELQQLDVVCVDITFLERIVSDLLLDIKHPKKARLRMTGRHYMEVTCDRVEDAAGDLWFDVKFENRATPVDAERARSSRSAPMAHYMAAEFGGSVRQEFPVGHVVRILRLPIFAPATN